MKKIFFLIVIHLLSLIPALAQNESEPIQPESSKWTVLTGLNQLFILNGFNAEINYQTDKWIIDYSHGFYLLIDGATLDNEYKNQKINFKITHSLGFGAGYRFNKSFNLRLEPKVHFYETYYDGERQVRGNSIANFTTYTLGIGAYYKWMPFETQKNALKGITIVPSLRYWYKIDSTLDDNKFTYYNTKTNNTETFKAPNIGLANTPIVLNVSVGYSF